MPETLTTTTVVHVRSPEWQAALKTGTAVYVGRNCPAFRGSPFGNPWKVGVFYADGRRVEYTRDDVIRFYREWAAGTRAHPKGRPFPHDLLETLRGKVLGCWCRPAACHADVLIELLEARHAR